MKTIIVLSVMLLSVIAVTIGTTITTIQIQPAYSQAQHCPPNFPGRCVTPGQNPSTVLCFETFCDDETSQEITHKEAGQRIGACHSNPGCTTTPPKDQLPPD
jgi:hypothetical protein